MNSMVKKIISCCMLISLCISLEKPISATNISETSQLEISGIINTIFDIYWQKDMGEGENTENVKSKALLSEDVEKYLLNKINTQQYVTRLYRNQKENYKVNVELIEKDEDAYKKLMYLKFQVITTFNYIGCEFNSSSSELVEIIYDLEGNRIVDFYVPNNYYDVAIRATPSVKKSTQKYQPFVMSEKEIANQNAIINEINEVYLDEEINVSNNNISAIEKIEKNETKVSSTLTLTKVSKYARNNYNKSNPASGNGSVPYYDFSQISGNYDCTNFVSHALLAGGANVYDTGGSGISSTGWYYRSISNRSSSWSGVNQLHNYLINSTKTNKAAGISETYTTNVGQWSKGYVLQLATTATATSFAHSTIITKKKLSDDGLRATAYVTGRTSSTQYNDNQKPSDIYPNGRKRIIYVYNY